MKRSTFACILLAVLALACSPRTSPATTTTQPPASAPSAALVSSTGEGADPVQQLAKLEEVRGHLVVSLAAAQANDVEHARAHATHAFTFSAIEPALKSKNPGLAKRIGDVLTENSRSLETKPDARQYAKAVEETDRLLEDARRALIPQAAAGDLAFHSRVLIGLLDAVTEEYREAVVDGKVKDQEEYQDAYGFFQRARALWRSFEDQVKAKAPHEYDEIEEQLSHLKATLPTFAPPQQLATPDQVEAWAKKLVKELSEATGIDESAAVTASSPAAKELGAITKHLDQAVGRVRAGDIGAARQAYREFDEGWDRIEDGIRAQSKQSYRAIEDAMHDVKNALAVEPPDAAKAIAALEKLDAECDTFIRGQSPSVGSTAMTVREGEATLPGLVSHLDVALAKLDSGDTAAAAAAVDTFRRDWTDVEGLVKAKSAQAYSDTENNMAKAYALLTQASPDTAGARATLVQMKADLAPFAEGETRYTVFDAAIILLREGLEALLVVAALIAFLKRTGNTDKSSWIWGGSGVGIAASIVVAVVVNLVFSRATAGASRELLEGLTGLVAAAMLIYVSYWLHSKASIGAWQRYIREQSTAALARNSLFSLGLIAFLAVFREGAETVLFYVGIAPSIALGDLALGLGLGAAGLVVIGVLILVFGVRVPIRPFFLGTSVLVYYLAFKFIGTGIHALQVAGILGATPGRFLPENGILGLFPTWETTAVQAVLLLGAVAVLVFQRVRSTDQVRGFGQPSTAG